MPAEAAAAGDDAFAALIKLASPAHKSIPSVGDKPVPLVPLGKTNLRARVWFREFAVVTGYVPA